MLLLQRVVDARIVMLLLRDEALLFVAGIVLIVVGRLLLVVGRVTKEAG